MVLEIVTLSILLDLIIAEIADPSDGRVNRFIDLYSPDNKDDTITDDIVLVRYEGSNQDPT